MYRFPDSAFDYINKKYNTLGLVKYALNWKKSRTAQTHLVPWLEQQVGEAISEGYLNAIKARIMNNTKEDDYDAIVIKVLRFVKLYMSYVGDIKVWRVGEYWQESKETYTLRTGDCEDGGIFIYVICRLCGVPANRLLIMAGDVEIGRTARTGGHCWCAYRPTYNPTEFKFLDWCYSYDDRNCFARNGYYIIRNLIYDASRKHTKYKRIWWAFNETQGFISINSRSLSAM